jgi:hypothetical protein
MSPLVTHGDVGVANFADRPCSDLLCVVVGFEVGEDETWVKLIYVNAEARFNHYENHPLHVPLSEFTLLSQYGRKLELNSANSADAMYYTCYGLGGKDSESQVKYKDGTTRNWQELTFGWLNIRPAALKFIATRLQAQQAQQAGGAS